MPDVAQHPRHFGEPLLLYQAGFGLPEFLFRPFAVHEQADFDPEICQHLEDIPIRLMAGATEAVDDAIQLLALAYGKANAPCRPTLAAISARRNVGSAQRPESRSLAGVPETPDECLPDLKRPVLAILQ